MAIPVIQQIAYCFDSESLRELYATLLASSMDKEKKWSVHPGYVDVIKQLTPDEAKIIMKLPNDASIYRPIVDVVLLLGKGNGEIEILRNYSI